MEFLSRGVLVRAVLFREVEEFTRSRCDLDAAMRIAERGGMRLFQCDAHLGYARLGRLPKASPTPPASTCSPPRRWSASAAITSGAGTSRS
jgi:hypothetical protein